DLLEANPADVVLNTETGRFAVTGSPSISKTWSEVASHLEATTGDSLKAETDFKPTGATFPFGAHLSVVEIDRGTGEVTVLRH
ncbi:MAG: molybdopterin cofactor-binding domain-containing protein, partial [Acidimicrobiales bacterium]